MSNITLPLREVISAQDAVVSSKYLVHYRHTTSQAKQRNCVIDKRLFKKGVWEKCGIKMGSKERAHIYIGDDFVVYRTGSDTQKLLGP